MRLLARLLRPLRNLVATADKDEPLRVWLDDLRPAPAGWYWALTAEEVVDVLRSELVEDLSLDHDLGRSYSGYDVIKWLAHQREVNGFNFWPLNRPTVHSSNPVGRVNIESVIERYGEYDENTWASRFFEHENMSRAPVRRR